MAVGRISGPLLKANLVRDDIPLSFRNGASDPDILYIDVSNARIGINTSSPTADLDVNGTTRTAQLILDNRLDVGNLHITGNTITSDVDTIGFKAAGGHEPTVYHSRLQIDEFEISGNSISTLNTNANIELRPSGTGTVEIFANTNIDGNLDVTGNITADGNVTINGDITLGDQPTDTIQINAKIESDIIPSANNTYNLGSPSNKWLNVYVNNFYTDALYVPTLDVGNLMFRDNEISTTTGEDLYIDGNGSGGVRLGNFKIVDNTITNVSSNAVTVIEQTGTGYFKIDTTNGFVPPVGDNAQRPTAYAVLGMTRFNTASKALEVWNGATWASPAGSSGAVSVTQAEDIAIALALSLG